MIFYRVLWVLLAVWTAYSYAGIESEHFEEDLVLRPLKDGRISALFSFTTTLENTSPRNPECLDRDDECTSSRAGLLDGC
jgi:GPI-anchor transamidase subunit T